MTTLLLFLSLLAGGPNSATSEFKGELPAENAIATTTLAPSETAGFEAAYFSRSGLQGKLSHAEAVGLRFYNVKSDSTDLVGTVMVVAVRADSSEIDGGAGAKKYVRSDGYSGSGILSTELTCPEAAQHCANMESSGLTSYSSTFTRQEIMDLTKDFQANSIRVTPGTVDGYNSMMLESVSIIRNQLVDLGSGPGFDLLDGDPCPVACGEDVEGNYINR